MTLCCIRGALTPASAPHLKHAQHHTSHDDGHTHAARIHGAAHTLCVCVCGGGVRSPHMKCCDATNDDGNHAYKSPHLRSLHAGPCMQTTCARGPLWRWRACNMYTLLLLLPLAPGWNECRACGGMLGVGGPHRRRCADALYSVHTHTQRAAARCKHSAGTAAVCRPGEHNLRMMRQ